jgi:hypothetical protein
MISDPISLQDEKHSIELYLNSNTFNYTLSGYFPFDLKINPNFLSSKNLYQIIYTIDGLISRTIKFFPDTPLGKDLTIDKIPSIAYPMAPGDPRNIIFSHLFENLSGNNLIHNIEIATYELNNPNISTYNIQLNLSSQQFLMGPLSAGFFKDIHLIKHRMFGPNNDIIYFFESEQPNYILPVLINWNK